jgi:hypothetical protein
MAIRTRLTKRLNTAHPILSAPMGRAAGGRLAAAVTTAGGRGPIGGPDTPPVAAVRRPIADGQISASQGPRLTIGATNCGSVSQGNRIQVSCDTSVMNVSTVARPSGFA